MDDLYQEEVLAKLNWLHQGVVRMVHMDCLAIAKLFEKQWEELYVNHWNGSDIECPHAVTIELFPRLLSVA